MDEYRTVSNRDIKWRLHYLQLAALMCVGREISRCIDACDHEQHKQLEQHQLHHVNQICDKYRDNCILVYCNMYPQSLDE